MFLFSRRDITIPDCPADKATFLGSSFSLYSTLDDSIIPSPKLPLIHHTTLPIFSEHRVYRAFRSLETNGVFFFRTICLLESQKE